MCKPRLSAVSLAVFMGLVGCGSSKDPPNEEPSGSGGSGTSGGSGGGTGAIASGGSSANSGTAAGGGSGGSTGDSTGGGNPAGGDPGTGGIGGNPPGGTSGSPTGGNGGNPTGGNGGNPTGGTSGSPTGGSGGDPTGGNGGDPAGGSGGDAAGGSGGDAPGGSAGDPTGGAGPHEVGETGTETIPGNGCTPPGAYANLFVSLLDKTQEESDAKVLAAWDQLYNPSNSNTVYYDGPDSDESYVKDTGNNDVRSEGMSYGMMTAVQLDKQEQFDRLWTWVLNHMANGEGEISWQCSPGGGKMSSGGAPDGEEYMATALIFAHNRWGSSGKYDYASEAQWVLDLIRTRYFEPSYHIVRFVSGSNNTDGSYILPAFYQVWSCFDTENSAFWDESVAAGREFFQKAANSQGVIPDQSSFSGGALGGAGSDAKRCVMNIMMDHNFFAADPWQTETYAPAFGATMRNGGDGSAAQFSCNALLGFGLPASDGEGFVDRLWKAQIPTGQWRYYDGTLYMLGLLHVSGTFKLYY